MQIKESTLRQLIRETLLTEAMMTPQSALDMGLRFEAYNDFGAVMEITAYRGDEFVGELAASKQDDCSGAWSIFRSQVKYSGLGPLMYDLMMELINPHPLMSDREEVSGDAKAVWDYYLKRRNDIESVQLDNRRNFLTQDPSDNCDQTTARDWAEDEGGKWYESSLSKGYRRKDGSTPTLDAMRRLGMISEGGG
jgi:hypothetical protein